MNTEHSTEETLDHVPSPAELLDSFRQSQQDDPRSVFYKRVLVRPRLPVGAMVLSLILTVVVCVLACVAVSRWSHSVLWGILACVGTLAVICLIFAKKILILAVNIYQAVAPERVRSRCRYEPSCSAYMLLAVEKYGLWKGMRKGLSRWRGCKPPNGGFDLP